jgi:hypothetical protein
LETDILFPGVDFVEDASDGGSSISDKEDKEDDPKGGTLTFGLGVAGVAAVLPFFPTIFSSSNFSLLLSVPDDARSASRPSNTLGFVLGGLGRCLQAWVANLFDRSNCGQE